jgi:4-carboxymuconolactone decarboxylase
MRAPILPPVLLHGGPALAATVTGREGAARRHYEAALAAGVPAVKLVEIARMAHLFGGFPRAIQGLKALERALAERGLAAPPDSEPGPRERSAERPRGETLFRRIYGESSDTVIALLDATAPGYSSWVIEDAYGRVLARPGLEPFERELLAVAALAALRCPTQLESHARGARRLGASAAQVDAMLASQATGSRKSGARQTLRRRRQ